MSRIETIEIPFEINAPEVVKQAQSVERSMTDIDYSVNKAQDNFKKFVNEQKQAQKVTNKSVGQMKSSYNGLQNSINQLSREMPAFTMSAQTGFMAISNNLPYLADSIANLKKENAALTASGQKATPIWKQLIGSLFSWQTLLSVGITLLTVYGKEIGNFIGQFIKGNNTLSETKQRLKAVNEAFKSSTYSKASKQVLKLKADFEAASKGIITKEKALGMYNKTVGKSMGKVKSFAEAEKKLIEQGDDYVKMMLYKAAALASLDKANDKIIEMEQEKLELDKKKSETREDFNQKSSFTKERIVGKSDFAPLQAARAAFKLKKAEKSLIEINRKIKETEQSSIEVYNSLMRPVKELVDKFDFKLYPEDTEDGGNRKLKEVKNTYQELLDELANLDKDYSQRTYNQDQEELNALKEKFDKVKQMVTDFNNDPNNKVKIDLSELNTLETKATNSLKYRQGTNKLVENLEQEKELYQAYEELKTVIGEQEAKKRSDLQFAEYESYLDRINTEIANTKAQTQTPETAERLAKLQALKTEEEQRLKNNESNRFVDAYESVVTYEERKAQLQRQYEADRIELSKITDEDIRKSKLATLEAQHQAKKDQLATEYYDQQQVFEQLSANLMGITKKQLENRINTLEQYLSQSKGLLSDEQGSFINGELDRAKAVMATTNVGVREKALLQEKDILLANISQKQVKGLTNVAEEIEALESVNEQLNEIYAQKAQKLANFADDISGMFSQLGDAVATSDEGLGDTLSTMGELAGAVAGVAQGFGEMLATGNPMGLIKGVVKGISTVIKLSAQARESERKAREEIRKYQAEIFASQLAYNAELRKRLKDEIKINDLYQSRVEMIKEQIEANRQSMKDIVDDQQAVFDRLLNSLTVVGKHTEKYGGFLGIGRKTKTVDEKKTIAELLGVGSYQDHKTPFGSISIFEPSTVKLTDELFDNLEKINSNKPLTDDAKTAYEQLKKLRDEYGSIEEAQRQLEIQKKDAITGTTAQSIADSIRQGIASGKKSFADFASDIEGFLRDAILAGMSAKMIEPRMQELQDMLHEFMGDEILTDDEKQQFQNMYMQVAEEAQNYMDMMNQAGVNVVDNFSNQNSLQGAYKTASQESINLLAGQTGGFRLTQLKTNVILTKAFASQMNAMSKMVATQMKIEANTKKTATNTSQLVPMKQILKEMSSKISSNTNVIKANGI